MTTDELASHDGSGPTIRLVRRGRKAELWIEGDISQAEMSDLVLEIADLAQDGELEGVASISDHSGDVPEDDAVAAPRRLLLSVKRGTDPARLLFELVDRFPLRPLPSHQ